MRAPEWWGETVYLYVATFIVLTAAFSLLCLVYNLLVDCWYYREEIRRRWAELGEEMARRRNPNRKS